jgi:hypothetical protein
MDEDFELPVNYSGKHLHFPAKLIRFGYSYRIEVDVNGVLVSFEKDEERNWRALVENHDLGQSNTVSPELFHAIAHSLDEF